MEEFEFAIKSCTSLCSGIDDISYKMIKEAPLEIKNVILKHFNNIWLQGVYPENWKTAVVLPLLKPGKDPALER